MRFTNIIAALVLLVLAATVLLGTWQLPYWADFAPGSSFAAFWVGVIGVILALGLLVTSVMDDSTEPHSFPGRSGLLRIAALTAGLWLMVLLIPSLGFVTASVLFCLFLLLGIERRPVMASLFTTVIVVGLVYGVFIAWLGIALPTGPLGI